MATYAQAVLAQSPNHYYRVDSNTTDSGSDGISLTLGASTAAPAYGTAGGTDGTDCLNFDGVNDYVKVSSVAWGSNAITISFWFYTAIFTGTQVWFESSALYGGTTGRSFLVYSDASNIQVGMYSGSGSGSVFDTATYSLPATSVFAHLAFIFDASASTTNRIVYYKNASLQTATSPTWQSGTNNFQTNDLFLMSRAGTSFFQGALVDDIALWKSRLTPTQISNQYTSTAPAGGASARRRPSGLYIR